MSVAPVGTLVFHQGALGDLITCLQAMQLWQQSQPRPLVAVTRAAHGELLRGLGLADAAWDSDGRLGALLHRGDGRVAELMSPLGTCGSALVFCAKDSPVPEALARAGVAQVYSHPPVPPDPQPVWRYQLQWLAHQLGVTPAPNPGWRLSIPSAVEPTPAVRGVQGQTLVVAPGSGSPLKNWPLERFHAVGDTLRSEGKIDRVVWLTGPAERERLTDIPADCHRIESPSLAVLAASLSACRLYLGNDTGTSHLAAAVGAATVAVFGPTDPVTWTPAGRRVRVVSPIGGPAQISQVPVAAVTEACLSLLE